MSFILANSLSIGNIVKIDNKLCEVLSKDHVKPGKGPAYIQLTFKDFHTGKKKSLRPSGSDRFEKMNIYVEEMQPLYLEDDIVILMDKAYNERRVDLSMLNKQKELFILDYKIIAHVCEEEIIKITLPDEIIIKVLDTPSYQKGSRSKLGSKSAQVSENISITVPSNLESEYIVINPNTLTFIKKYMPHV